MASAWAGPALVAFLTALVLTRAIRGAAFRWQLIDRPEPRSSHRTLIPTGGGVAILLATLAGTLAFLPRGAAEVRLAALALGALLVAAVALWDDRAGLPVLHRFACQIAAAGLVIAGTGGLTRLPLPSPLDLPLGPLGAPLTVLWVVAVTNFFNFIDGIDGLAGLQAVVTGLAIALAGWDPAASLIGVAIAGACAGFLAYNWSPASIFMGDVGSHFLGYTFAVLPFLAPDGAQSSAVLFVAVSLWLFLADASFTFARRVARGERWYQPHREHLYQRIVDAGASHGQVALAIGVGSAVVSVAALLAWREGAPAWGALGLAVGLFAVEAWIVRELRRTAREPVPAGQPTVEMGWRWRLSGIGGWQRFALILGLDAILITVSLYVAFFLRFEGALGPDHYRLIGRFLPLLLGVRLPVHVLLGIHRWSFRLSGFHEAVRVTLACLLGTAGFTALLYFLMETGPPRSIVAIELLVTLALVGGVRFSPRMVAGWVRDARRTRGTAVRTLIVGAGSAGELLLRDLHRSLEHSYEVAGFVDDEATKWGTFIGGRPVLGPLSAIPELARRRGVQELLFAIPRLPHAHLREIVESCAELKLTYKVLPVSFAYLNDRVSSAMLQDLSPEDLLARSQAQFDEDEMRRLLEGRRVLVTGAAGSIGSEICRQVARRGPEALVLADINENDLYFLYRDLQQAHPGLPLFAEVADIRDAARLEQLGRRYRVQDVFHAAAHKHVPLMEEAPEEAIKNNVLGCLNVVNMAESVGASRFVLISTDKAANPSSVMGASKRIAEMIVRSRAGRGRGAFTAVRFGNVLGSAGSVVPLFKQQIAAGGPVTVTHPECRRFLMTIPEAVGLVILAGLGGYGDLCILEMGEPIRILDLARLMITLAGLVPDRDVPIVFTGLRPGEKLDEELMTAEEAAQSHRLRGSIRVIDTVEGPLDLQARIDALGACARVGDREALLAEVRALVPAFESPAAVPAPVTD
ncbi:MAG TPA: SDR family NAD(P)-dependent oxidoreductase [Vicinamibacteria bacterium]